MIGTTPKDRTDNFAGAWMALYNSRAASKRSRTSCVSGTPVVTHGNPPIADVLRALRETGGTPKHRSYWNDGGSVILWVRAVVSARKTWPLSQFMKFYSYNEKEKLHTTLNYMSRQEFATTEIRRPLYEGTN